MCRKFLQRALRLKSAKSTREELEEKLKLGRVVNVFFHSEISK